MWDLYNRCNGEDWVQMEQNKTEGQQMSSLGGKHKKKTTRVKSEVQRVSKVKDASELGCN